MTPEERKRLADLLREVADDLEADRMHLTSFFGNQALAWAHSLEETTHETVTLFLVGERELNPS